MNRHISFLAELILCFSICGTAQAIVQYTVTDLGTLGGTSSRALGINASGQVVGWADTTGDAAQHTFLYSGSTMTDLNILIDPASGWELMNALDDGDINDAGQIVGTGVFSDGTHGYLYSGSTVTDLGSLGTVAGQIATFPTGINASGQVVGFSWLTDAQGNNVRHAFRYSGGMMVDLGILGGNSGASRINASGQVVGTSYTTYDVAQQKGVTH